MSIDAARAALAYARQTAQDIGEGAGGAGAAAASETRGAQFGELLAEAVGDVVETGKTAEMTAAKGMAGEAALIDVVTAVSAAETTLQTAVAVRDKVVQAYQEIIRMPI